MAFARRLEADLDVVLADGEAIVAEQLGVHLVLQCVDDLVGERHLASEIALHQPGRRCHAERRRRAAHEVETALARDVESAEFVARDAAERIEHVHTLRPESDRGEPVLVGRTQRERLHGVDDLAQPAGDLVAADHARIQGSAERDSDGALDACDDLVVRVLAQRIVLDQRRRGASGEERCDPGDREAQAAPQLDSSSIRSSGTQRAQAHVLGNGRPRARGRAGTGRASRAC